jgi:uncharacterized protein YukE
MSTLYGANPDQLEHLGSTLKRQIEAINSVMSTVTSALSGTTWMGPARDQFEQEWQGSFRSALTRLNDAFEAAGQDCVLRTQELRRVMGTR